MKSFISLSLLVLGLAIPYTAWGFYPPSPYPQRTPQSARIPNLNGVWHLNGDEYNQCLIRQRPGSTRALFINENGSEAMGHIRGNRVFIPDWSWTPEEQGLEGIIRGNRIIWPNGTFWVR